MINSVYTNYWGIGQRALSPWVPIGLSLAILLILGLATVQDLMGSNWGGYAFYLGESLVFKTVWILFIPIMAVLHQVSKNTGLASLQKMIGIVLIALVLHLLLAAILGFGLSLLFLDGRHGPLKFLSYFLVHDITAMAIIYGGSVGIYRYFPIAPSQDLEGSQIDGMNRLVLKQGNRKVMVSLDEIVQIRSATPYISIHMGNRKYLHFETLKGICRQLDGRIFMRVHKSTVVNLAMVESFRSRSNGDYDLLLKNGESVRLSRTYAKGFKAHFKLIPRDTL